MAKIYYHYDKEKMIKKSSRTYYSTLRLTRIILLISIILNILLVF